MEEAPRLNADVLAIVCEFLSVPDLISFSLTCSALHPIAILRLLHIHPVSLTCEPSIRRFHYFLFADLPARAPHIRALEIGSQRCHSPKITDNPGEYSLLVEILASCTRLEHLLLSPKDTSHHPYDPWPIAKAATLSRAKPTNVHTLLPMVRAPLRTLSIHTANPGDRPYWTLSALEAILPPFTPTLEKLGLCNLFIDVTEVQGLCDSPPQPSTLPLTRYPAVRSLSVYSLRGAPLLDVLQHLFPALNGTLHLQEWKINQMNTHVSTRKHIRTTNQRTQQRRGDSAWKKLDRLVCEPAMFYMLGLRCPIGLLMIERCAKHMKDDLALAFRENPVARLKLSLLLDPGLGVFDVLLSAGLGGTLTHLTLCLVDIRVNEDVHDADGMTPTGLLWDAILDRMRASLAPLQKLTHLRAVVHCDIWPGPFASPMARPNFTHAFRNAEAVELGGVSASLVCVLPSLRFVSITISAWCGNGIDDSERWQVSRAWRVAEPASDDRVGQMQEGKITLVDLSEEAAAAVIRKEELIVSEGDKLLLHTLED